MKKFIISALVASISGTFALASTTLGSFTFNDNLFGNSLVESDGGTHANGNYLNTAGNVNPGNPGYLTGNNFKTGVANIGLAGPVEYRINYLTTITDIAGDDFGVVVARYSSDPFDISVSQDGVTFSPVLGVSAATAVATGVSTSYYYAPGGQFTADLYVHSFDLSTFGVASVKAIKVRGYTELDLIRVAGFEAVPEPASVAAFAVGALALLRRRRA